MHSHEMLRLYEHPALYDIAYQMHPYYKCLDTGAVSNILQTADAVAHGRIESDYPIPKINRPYKILEGFSWHGEHIKPVGNFPWLVKNIADWHQMDLNADPNVDVVINGDCTQDKFPEGTNIFLALYFPLVCLRGLDCAVKLFENIRSNCTASGGWAVIHLCYGDDPTTVDSAIENNKDDFVVERPVSADSESVWQLMAASQKRLYGDLTVRHSVEHMYDQLTGELTAHHSIIGRYKGKRCYATQFDVKLNYLSLNAIAAALRLAGFDGEAAGWVPFYTDFRSGESKMLAPVKYPADEHDPTELLLWVRGI